MTAYGNLMGYRAGVVPEPLATEVTALAAGANGATRPHVVLALKADGN